MSVVRILRFLLRGIIRAQVRYTIRLLNKLIKAYVKSGEILPIATGLDEGACPVTFYEAIISQLTTGLTMKG